MDPQQKLYEQGLVLMKHKRYDDALSRFEWALDYYAATDAASAETWYRIGCCRSELAKRKIEVTEEMLYVDGEFELYEGAIEAYQKVIELQPNHLDARMSLGTLFYDFGVRGFESGMCDVYDYSRVIEWFEQAAKANPDLIDSYYQLGLTYTCLMDDFANDAIYEIDDWAIRDGMCFTGIVGIADARIETYKKLSEIQPNDAKAFYELGNAYTSWIYPFIAICEEFGNETRDEIKEMKHGKAPEIRDILNKAIKSYLKAVEINPVYTDAYNDLAKVYHWCGNYREAIRGFKKAFVLVKFSSRENGTMTSYDYGAGAALHNLARAYHNLGKQNFVIGNYTEAIECYHDAILACSWYHQVYYDLAVANDETGNYESAILWYGRVKYSYEYPDLCYRLAKAQHRLGHYQDAVEAYQKAINRQMEMEDEFLRKSSDNLHYAEPLEYPEWWTEVYQNYESASRNEPL